MIGPTFALFIRSLREDTRAKFTPIGRASLVLVVLFFIAIQQRSFIRNPAPGLQVFFTVMMVNLFGLVLGGITAFCSSITEEKEDDTLGLLRMTNLSPLAILFGKGVSRLVSGALLIVSQLPFTMLCVTLGGVSAATIWKGYEVLLCTLFFLCCLGLLTSVIAKRTGIAVALTVFVGAVIYVGVPVLYMTNFAQNRFGGGTSTQSLVEETLGWVMSNHPLYQLTMLIQGGGRGFLPPVGSPWLFHGIGGIVCFLLAWALFGRFCSGTAETAPRKKSAKPGSKSLRIPRPGSRPLVWKDFWFLIGGRRGLISRFIGYGVLTFGIIAWAIAENSYMESKVVGEMMIVFAGFGLGVELVIGSASIFGLERKGLTLSSLLTLPVPLGRIVRHKILGVLGSFIPGLCFVGLGMAMTPGSVAEFFRDVTRRDKDVILFSYMLLHLVAVPLLTCWLSLKMRRGAVAAAIAIGVIWNVLLGIMSDIVGYEAFGGLLIFTSVVLVAVSLMFAGFIAKGIPRAGAVE